MPSSGSKNFGSCDSAQPPRSSSIVNRCAGVWKSGELAPRPPASTGRKPWLPKTVCASGVKSEVDEGLRGLGRIPVQRHRDGFSMRSVLSGTTYSSGLAGLLGEDRLVLVGDEHVALARLGRSFRASRALGS